VPEEELEARKPQEVRDLVARANEDWEGSVAAAVRRYSDSRVQQRILEFHTHLTRREHIRVQAAGLSPSELVDIVATELGDEVAPLRPLAAKLEGGAEKE
jgi:hypothetical protein